MSAKPLLENINFTIIFPEHSRNDEGAAYFTLAAEFIKRGSAKRLTPKARYFLVNGKTHLFRSKCSNPSETFHKQVHLLFPSPPPIFAISAASPKD